MAFLVRPSFFLAALDGRLALGFLTGLMGSSSFPHLSIFPYQPDESDFIQIERSIQVIMIEPKVWCSTQADVRVELAQSVVCQQG